MHNYTQMNPTLMQITILDTFRKSYISTPPKSHVKFFDFWKSKMSATTQTPTQ